MKSIFQGSNDIRKVIAESLELSTDQRDRFDYTYPIYHTAFFYLQKRFGVSEFYDEDKEAGCWILEFKGVQFVFRFHSDSVEIWVLGNGKDYLDYNVFPNQKAYIRTIRKYPATKLYLFENSKEKLTKDELELHHQEVNDFFGTKTPSNETIEEKLEEWHQYVFSFNEKKKWELYEKHAKYTKEQYLEFEKKHGRCNSQHRYLLKILKKLLKAFIQEPIWVRDVPFNIKGRMDGKDIRQGWSYIKLIKK